MKIKIAFVLTLLVLASLISFSNRCKPSCDGSKLIVMCSQPAPTNEQAASYDDEDATVSSPLLRIAVTL